MNWPENIYQPAENLAPDEPVSLGSSIADAFKLGKLDAPTTALTTFLQGKNKAALEDAESIMLGTRPFDNPIKLLNENRVRLSEEQAKKSPWYNPQINVKNGIYEDELKRKSQLLNKKNALELQIQNSPQTFIGGTTRLGAQVAAQVSDPVNILFGTLAVATMPEDVLGAIGLGGAAIDSPFIKSMLEGAVKSIFEGTTISLPQIAANTYNDDTSVSQILSTIGYNIGFAGAIHGIFGTRQLLRKNEAALAKETAIKQGIGGTVQNVDKVLKQGFFSSRRPESGTTTLDDGFQNLTNLIQKIANKNLSNEQLSKLRESVSDLDEKSVNILYPNDIKSLMEDLGINTDILDFSANEGVSLNLDESNIDKLVDKSNDFLDTFVRDITESEKKIKNILNSKGISDKDLNDNYLTKIANDYFDDHINTDTDLDGMKLRENTKRVMEGNYPSYTQLYSSELSAGKY